MRQSLRCIWLFLVVLLMACSAGARVLSVSSASTINNGSWCSGDTLLMSAGTWNNQKITLQGNGTASAPIVLRCSTPGATVLTGSSAITLDGSYLVVDGLLFSGTYTGTSAIVTFKTGSHHCRLTRSEIRSYNLSDHTKDTKWVSLNGQDHRVDHCAFSNKTNIGTLLVVWLKSGIEARHRIDHNCFGRRTPLLDEKGSELNGQEIIRIGDSSTSMTAARCVVECNWFEQCNGEIEVISNKSCFNLYRANTFYRCAGMLTLRHGNDCEVRGNRFLGGDSAKTGGVRVIGERHVVVGNYMEGLTGTNYRSALCIVRGKENSALSEYFQVQDARLDSNVMVNCKMGICINYNSSEYTLAPVRTMVRDNAFYLDAKHKSCNLITVADSTAGLDVRLSGNKANQGQTKNCSLTSSQLLISSSLTADDSLLPDDIATKSNTGPLASEVATDLQDHPLLPACHYYTIGGLPLASPHIGVLAIDINNGKKTIIR